jgi:hypothetical protein
MKPCPKPQKGNRQTANKVRLTELKHYRHEQYRIIKNRDGGYCTICYFIFGKKKKAHDVHHVYGRGRNQRDYREQYVVMLSTCRECHPPAIHAGPGTTHSLGYVEAVLVKANKTPINSQFQHESTPNV